MARRYETNYRLKGGENLGDPEFWNRRLDDLDRRIDGNEQALSDVDAVADRIEGVALQRLDNVVTPLVVETRERIRNLSRVFQADSVTAVTPSTGTKTLFILDGQRNTFVALDYVSIRSVADPDKAMQGRLVSFNADTGELTVQVDAYSGTGPASDWHITLSAPPDLLHAARTDNPHGTTAEQVGAYTKAQVDALLGDEIDDARNAIVDGAPESGNTLKKLATALSGLNSSNTTLTTELGKRLRFDTADNLNEAQRGNVLSALGLSVYFRGILGLNSKDALRGEVGISSWAAGLVDDTSAAIARKTLELDTIYQRRDWGGVKRGTLLNGFHNGSFRLWQRGDVITSGLMADRWWTNSTYATMTCARSRASPNDLLGSESGNYAYINLTNPTGGASSFSIFGQNIEGVRSFAGRRVCVSGLVRKGSGAAPSFGIALVQDFGSGGGASPRFVATGTAINYGATGIWTPFSAFFDIPSVSAKTIGNSGTDRLEVQFILAAGASSPVASIGIGLNPVGADFSDLQIVEMPLGIGDVIPPYFRVPASLDEMNCRRYFTKGAFRDIGFQNANTGWGRRIEFPVQMRADPTIAIVNTTSFNCSGFVAENPTALGFTVTTTAQSTGPIEVVGTYTASAEI
ncbi:hypothetical protein [uncultured Methylobacterium sp.]|jgi:hypothetical protein|uniref:hypothetical protein n=1 Tax=uncultured Methylobacterium sp. TaxID=157278 RepID=UPI00260E2BCB|nr:hypothetical protein [uncultured Methylobacterium sp.]